MLKFLFLIKNKLKVLRRWLIMDKFKLSMIVVACSLALSACSSGGSAPANPLAQDTPGKGAATGGGTGGSQSGNGSSSGSGSSTEGSGSNTEGSGSNTEGSGSNTEGSGSNTEGSGSNTEDSGSGDVTVEQADPASVDFSATFKADTDGLMQSGVRNGASVTYEDKSGKVLSSGTSALADQYDTEPHKLEIDSKAVHKFDKYSFSTSDDEKNKDIQIVKNFQVEEGTGKGLFGTVGEDHVRYGVYQDQGKSTLFVHGEPKGSYGNMPKEGKFTFKGGAVYGKSGNYVPALSHVNVDFGDTKNVNIRITPSNNHAAFDFSGKINGNTFSGADGGVKHRGGFFRAGWRDEAGYAGGVFQRTEGEFAGYHGSYASKKQAAYEEFNAQVAPPAVPEEPKPPVSEPEEPKPQPPVVVPTPPSSEPVPPVSVSGAFEEAMKNGFVQDDKSRPGYMKSGITSYYDPSTYVTNGVILTVGKEGKFSAVRPEGKEADSFRELKLNGHIIPLLASGQDLLNGISMRAFNAKDLKRDGGVYDETKDGKGLVGSTTDSFHSEGFKAMRFGVYQLEGTNHLFVQGQPSRYMPPASDKDYAYEGYAVHVDSNNAYSRVNGVKAKVNFGKKTVDVTLKPAGNVLGTNRPYDSALSFSATITGNTFSSNSGGVSTKGGFFGGLGQDMGGVYNVGTTYKNPEYHNSKGVFGTTQVDPRKR
ncbi:hypothetical protein l11_19620 [Neisseria weaveri LMG 5135]|nr:hypothetical protein l11_19620 [Neisseria weaveri LMG 5135]